MILLGSQFIALHESHVILKKAQLHPEKIIELADFLALSLQFTFSLDTFRGFTCQRSRDRPVVRQSCGINVPALVYLACENYIYLWGWYLLLAHREMDRGLHLCHSEDAHKHQGRHCHDSFHTAFVFNCKDSTYFSNTQILTAYFTPVQYTDYKVVYFVLPPDFGRIASNGRLKNKVN